MSVRHLELVLRQIPVSPSDTQQIFLVQRTLHFEPEISELKFLIEEMNRQLDRDIAKQEGGAPVHPDLVNVILHKREEKKQ